MSFPVPHTEHSDVAMHHLPQQLAPSWCTKPQDTWMAGAGFDIGADSDDAGPFRWFIDERSLSAPGEHCQGTLLRICGVTVSVAPVVTISWSTAKVRQNCV